MSDHTALNFICPTPVMAHQEIVLAHGSGGTMSRQLVEEIIVREFANPHLEVLHDGATFSVNGTRLAFSTDSYVINPIFFPGGDIGSLAVHGTVNDLAMCGAKPLYLSVGFILEEGLPQADFRRIVRSMRDAAAAAGVALITGDTKVVDRGKVDKIFISTSGIGAMREGVEIDPRRARPGDRIILSGTIADHGIAILSVREGLEFESVIASDSAALNGLADSIFSITRDVRVLRDPTRGGLASAVCEIAGSSGQGILLDEISIPVREDVQAACEMLGLDPLHVANEGKLVAFVPEVDATAVLEAMRAHPLGRDASIIGEVTAEHPGMVFMKTRVGGSRIVDMLAGEQLPRIC